MIKKGSLQAAYNDLKANDNNAVAHVFDIKEPPMSNKPLANCIFTIKDNYADVACPTRGSSKFLETFQSSYEATVLKLLRESGALCVARTNLDEFGMGGSGEYSAYGVIKHPQNHQYMIGGSSSGAAATFSDNISFAIGSDTGDSVRKPASNIGKVGFKPSYGAISRYGLFSFATSLDTVAYFTHNVNDAIELSHVLFKQDLANDLTSKDLSFKLEDVKLAKPKTVAYLDCFDKLAPAVAKAYQGLLDQLKKANVQLIKIDVDEKMFNSIDVVYKVISFSEASSNLANLTGIAFGPKFDIEGDWEETVIAKRSQKLGKMVQSRLILGSYFLEEENQIKYFVKAKKMRQVLFDYFSEIHSESDCFIYPAASDSAPKFDENIKPNYMDFILTYGNLVGNPSMTMKLGTNKENNMPFNIAIDCAVDQDLKLFSHALYLEKLIKGGCRE
ncbi:aspartyl/glutamyl-tRNA(Asn/Gln) amidotransferase subunit A [Metamycoplasma arthritidis]|uniref:Glutamyl-tRNA amidotransferase subunit A n=1 Tax=Metamycoplasma arthritidis (strain 158L3-1) TaxID=243272 RepID=B3PLS9_META1|nr:amidase family protein [Metamycoplasma arthritidis]ACF06981.1 glutamyl-tRNA amidotransferase subunit A [Metamycoplasma arthritidis 158L3-1]VEU78510.1 aspartyl/glutamyl-tRNA(Asn/Gln) amidotransferase subunit A [Metamycoplasma arthritidis]